MVRTIITLSEKDKRWLENYSREHHTSLAGAVRKAVSLLKESSTDKSGDEILSGTAGLLKNKIKDGLVYQKELRNEWR